ncbi:MAG: carboxymuconolactone decarboxylase family protein [Longimicrobiales bacterium]
MKDVRFRDTRFDPDLVEFHDLAKRMAKSVGYTATLSVDKQLAQLLRLRVAQMNPCSYCLILHTQAAHDQGISASRVAALSSWRETGLYSDSERAALAYCEGLTAFDVPGFSSLHEGLGTHFNSQQIAEIAAIIINMNLWTRLKMAQGATPVAVEEAE